MKEKEIRRKCLKFCRSLDRKYSLCKYYSDLVRYLISDIWHNNWNMVDLDLLTILREQIELSKEDKENLETLKNYLIIKGAN